MDSFQILDDIARKAEKQLELTHDQATVCTLNSILSGLVQHIKKNPSASVSIDNLEIAIQWATARTEAGFATAEMFEF